MGRRTGNNYSGARWSYSTRRRHVVTPAEAREVGAIFDVFRGHAVFAELKNVTAIYAFKGSDRPQSVTDSTINLLRIEIDKPGGHRHDELFELETIFKRIGRPYH